MKRAPNRPNLEFFQDSWTGKAVFRAPDPEVLARKATSLLRAGWFIGKVTAETRWVHVGGRMYIDEFYEFRGNPSESGASAFMV